MLAALCLCSCGAKQDANRKPTFPVTGQLLVDGNPAEDVQITCHAVGGVDKENPTSSRTDTGEHGVFKFSTYAGGDGVPEGDYVLTFFWGQTNVFTREYVGPDKLNDRYRDPKKSEVSFTVKKGAPTDLGTIELTSK
jgi:hypothetical protein